MAFTIIDLLDNLKKQIESVSPVNPEYLKSSSSYNGFEHLVADVLKNFQIPSMETNKIKFNINFGHYFPDIDVFIDGVRYGVELKSRTDGSWKNNGGSVFESISNNDYQEIYILFGTFNKKLGEQSYKVRYAPYWQCAEAIKVTHKPRYYLNMDTNQSVFSSNEDYQNLRLMSEEEKNKYVQKKLRETANKSTWYIAEDTAEQIGPTLIKDLSASAKNRIISELMIIFPQDLLKTIKSEKGRSDYTRSTEYLISSYFYYSPATRDLFSAGGKFEYRNAVFPQIVERYRDNHAIIETILIEQTDEFREKAYASWSELPVELDRKDILTDFKNILDYLGSIFLSNTLKGAGITRLSEVIF
ncbi:hypothetical protein CN324_13890 [Bacillus anthracis]|nr:hypothetical protein CN385_02430 [Bacillus anthracis]PFF20142.1 hypothetical protein CN324_13890 [Bacillus anthracis]PGP27628.1 hypothetical protein CN994_07040 [Bacillus anthracis]